MAPATVRWTTDQILRQMLPDDIPVEYTIDNGEVVVATLPAPTETVGKHTSGFDLDGRRKLIAVSRFGVPRVPDESLAVQDGDILHFSIIRGDVAGLAEELKKVGRPE